MTTPTDRDSVVELLLGPWPGPGGGIPPLDRATPGAIERAYEIAVQRTRQAVRAIAADPEPPDFANTVAALEEARRRLRWVHGVFDVFARTRNLGEMREVQRRLAPLLPALEDEITRDGALWGRVREVWASRDRSGLTGEQRRLTEVVHDRFVRRGADLDDAAGRRLAEINARIAALEVTFSQNTLADEDEGVVWLESEDDLEDLGAELREALAAEARARGRDGGWAVANRRTLVIPLLSASPRRDLRERVWRMWTGRGAHEGVHDNRPVVAEILRLRGEKARLLGFPSYAHLVTADRMCGDPETAMALVRRVWDAVDGGVRSRLECLEEMAAADGVEGGLAPWDRRYYAEQARRRRDQVDAEVVRAHLALERMIEAVLWAAGRLFGLGFVEDPEAPKVHEDVRVFAVQRGGVPAGMLWLDLFARPGKASGGWMWLIRPGESSPERVLPLTSINLNLTAPAPGQPALMSWEEARVLFHELGHALHALLCDVASPSLGMLALNPDALELPSILNERWLATPEVLRRFALHHSTAEPMPQELVDALEAARREDPGEGETASLDYLATAVVDLELHLAADGSDVDPVALEERALSALRLPAALEPLHRASHLKHAFAGLYEDSYASCYHGYLWAEMLAADVAEAFEHAPGGLYDRETAERYRRSILSVGHRVPAAEAFEAFTGRGPDPAALMRRLGAAGRDPSLGGG